MINRMVLQGRLVKDSEIRTTTSGVSVLSGTVAWSDKYKDNERQLFMPFTAWRGTAEFIQKYFVKGQEIAVEGLLTTRRYTANDGTDRTITEMTVDKVHFCGQKKEREAGPPPEPIAGFEDIGGKEGLPF